ncbi:hypothetical protein D3C72_2017630 [compost metagenome]
MSVTQRDDALSAHQDGFLRRFGAGGKREGQGGGEDEATQDGRIRSMAHVVHLS